MNNKLNLKIYSLNVNGLGENIKRKAVFNKLRKFKDGIFLIQETHSTYMKESIWKNQWGNRNIYFAHGQSNSRGVATLFSQNVQYKLKKSYNDEEGRILILDIDYNGCIVTIVNLYAPTRNHEEEQVKTLNKLYTELQNFTQENIIWGATSIFI